MIQYALNIHRRKWTLNIEQIFIEDAGNLAQSFGLGRVVGELYAYLYFSPEPRGLQDMQEALDISKGSASMCVRQLESWGAVKKVSVPGNRRDYYEAKDWFGRALKNVIVDVVSRRFASREGLYERIADELESIQDDVERKAFLEDRIARLRRFETKALATWSNPILQRFLR